MAEETKKVLSFSERKTAEEVGKVASDVQKLLNDKLKNRSNREVLVQKFIIREAVRPDVFAQRGQSLGKLLENRAPKAKLMQLNVIKEEGGDAVAPLPTIGSTRDKLAALMTGSPQRSAMARHLPMDPEAKMQRSAKIQEARSVLTPFMLNRPTPEKLVQQKVITDIGDLPSHDELKDQGFESTPQLVAALQDQKIEQVACGWGHSAVVNDKGKMSTFGSTLNGRLGHGNQNEKYVGVPEQVKFLSAIGRVAHIDCGDNHTAAVANHILYTWGVGSWGRLGLGDVRDAHSPMPVKDELVNHKVIAVACGAYHTLVLTKDNKVFAFGWNKNGRLGLGAEAARAENLTYPSPVLIPSLSSVVAISAALDFSLAINDQGQLFSWGCGRSGALGHADAKDTVEPKAVAALSAVKIKSVVSGAAHTLAVSEDGKLYSFGENRSGQLGREVSPASPGPVPTQVPFEGPVVAAAAGKAHSIAVLADGSVWSWGGGSKGVLGHGNEDSLSAPKRIEALAGVKIVNATCGWVHTVLLSDEGRVYAFGTRENGKLGV